MPFAAYWVFRPHLGHDLIHILLAKAGDCEANVHILRYLYCCACLTLPSPEATAPGSRLSKQHQDWCMASKICEPTDAAYGVLVAGV